MELSESVPFSVVRFKPGINHSIATEIEQLIYVGRTLQNSILELVRYSNSSIFRTLMIITIRLANAGITVANNYLENEVLDTVRVYNSHRNGLRSYIYNLVPSIALVILICYLIHIVRKINKK